MSESIYKNDELENEMSLDMSYFWYSDVLCQPLRYSESLTTLPSPLTRLGQLSRPYRITYTANGPT